MSSNIGLDKSNSLIRHYDMLGDIRGKDIEVGWVQSYSEARQQIERDGWDVMLVDYDPGAGDGLKLIQEAVENGINVPLIMVTGRGRYELDVEAMKRGAADYITKNMLNSDLLERVIRYSIERSRSKEILEQLVEERTLVLANAQARALLILSTGDIGKPLQALKLSYQPIELCSLIDQAKEMHEPKELKEVPWTGGESNDRFYDISVAALESENVLIGVSLSFLDVSQHKRLQKQLEHTNQELETAMEELESTNEELETTNEELQSTIEELETTNEELQATNEELETMNEELQATNEELETLNVELGTRSSELNEIIAYLNSILSSISSSVIVVNKDYLVVVWNPKSEDLWGLHKEEVLGQSFFGLDIGLPGPIETFDPHRVKRRECAGDVRD